jgi:hypothetical protein
MSLEPAFWLVVGGVYDLNAEAEEESVEERVAQVAQIVKEHVEPVAPDSRIAI